jgi:hypothetical protein
MLKNPVIPEALVGPVKPTVNQADFDNWYKMQQELKDLKEAEALLRMKIYKAAFPDAHEGTNNLPLTEGFILKAKVTINRKVDIATFEALKDKLLEAHIKVDKLVVFKPDLGVTYYKTLGEEEQNLVAQFLIIKEGTPALEVVKPKRTA